MPNRNAAFPVIEAFGPTVQGEGDLIGTPCYFIRFGGCDYACSWCDSKYAVNADEVRENAVRMTRFDIMEEIESLDGDARLVVLSGGNPALHDLTDLVADLHVYGYKVAVETQGTKFPAWLLECDEVTISPKPPSSGMKPDLEHIEDMIRRCAASPNVHVSVKIVVFDDDDYKFASDLLRSVRGMEKVSAFMSVGNHVGDDDTETLINRWRTLSEIVMHDSALSHVRVLPQAHVLMWGNKRGV